MATTDQLAEAVLRGRAYYIQLLDEYLVKLKGGGDCGNHRNKLLCLKKLIRSIQWDLNNQVYNDITSKNYERLILELDGFYGSILPSIGNVVIPGIYIQTGVQGPPGKDGLNGKSAYQLFLDSGFEGTEEEWRISLRGSDGKSSYELAVLNGYAGTLEEWLSGIIDVTHAEFIALQTANSFVKGQRYRITDFQTVQTVVAGVTNVGPVEPLIVTAAGVNSIDTEVYSELYSWDELVYLPNANYNGATKGLITARRDTINNVFVSNDWRHLKYRRYKFNAPAYVAGTTYARYAVVMGSDNNIYASVDPNNVNNAPAEGSAFWYLLIHDATQYHAPSTNFFNVQVNKSTSAYHVGGTVLSIPIPVNNADFIDTVMFPNYQSDWGKFQNVSIKANWPGNPTPIVFNNANQNTILKNVEINNMGASQSTVTLAGTSYWENVYLESVNGLVCSLKGFSLLWNFRVSIAIGNSIISINADYLSDVNLGNVQSCVLHAGYFIRLQRMAAVILPTMTRNLDGEGLANIRFSQLATIRNLKLGSYFGIEYTSTGGKEVVESFFIDHIAQTTALTNKTILGAHPVVNGTARTVIQQTLADLATNDVVDVSAQFKIAGGLQMTQTDIFRTTGKKAIFQGDIGAPIQVVFVNAAGDMVGQGNFTFDPASGQFKVNTTTANNNYKVLLGGNVLVEGQVLTMNSYLSTLIMGDGAGNFITDGNGLHIRLFNNDLTDRPDASKSIRLRNKGFVFQNMYIEPLTFNGQGEVMTWRQINRIEKFVKMPDLPASSGAYQVVVRNQASAELELLTVNITDVPRRKIQDLPLIDNGDLSALNDWDEYRTSTGETKFKVPSGTSTFTIELTNELY